MARKNSNATKGGRSLRIQRNRHFYYTPGYVDADATVVRFLGKQDADYVYCYHPDGFPMWIHVSELYSTPSR